MSTRVVERVDDWSQQSFSDGYLGLHDLADREFSGVVRAGGAELFMTKGVVVGVRRGSIESFEGASGTRYEAPTSALPLLAVMQERGDEVRAQYYTEDTPVSEVSQTLEDGGFTGYVELSENVLSGDYYLVYHRGRSMSVAYVGNTGRLVDGDEAFDQANDEVGIYEVRPVDVEAIDIPEPTDDEVAEADSPAAAPESSTDEPEEAGAENAAETADDDPEATGASTQGGEADADTESEESAGQGRDGPDADDGPQGEESDPPAGSDRTEPDAGTADGKATESEVDEEPTDTSGASDGSGTAGTSTSKAPGTGAAAAEAGAPGQTTERSGGPAGSAADLETKAIPSLDPGRSRAVEPVGSEQRPDDSAGRQPQSGASGSHERGQAATAGPAGETAAQAREPRGGVAEDGAGTEPGRSRARETDAQRTDETETPDSVEELEERLTERRERIDQLEGDLEQMESERDDARAELASSQEERDELREEVEQLEAELERLETELGAATDAQRRMTPQEALEGTDLFVRYHSKGNGTLEKAHDAGIRREEFTDNLRLEKHTQFDADGAAVGGQTYDQFLEETVEYRFVQWVVRDLLFEIQSTGNTDALADLYDALPAINRVELNGAVTVTDEDGNEGAETFDVVFRERMGEPLLVANINDSREGATEAMMEGLVTAAERVGQTADEFASAFLVTQSFFEPAALETVAAATRGGILSRDKRKSFVNLSRKRGYHLCLVEARNENFHLEVPEL